MQQPPSTPRCFLVEDDSFAQNELAYFLTDLEFAVTSAGTYDEALRLLDQPEPFRLAVVDLRLRRDGERRPAPSPEHGLDLIHRIKQSAPGTAVVIWTGYEDQVPAVVSMAAKGWGGLAYVIKGSLPEELRTAIDHALLGAVYMQPGLRQPQGYGAALLAALPPDIAPLVERIAAQLDTLSPRELEIAALLMSSTDSIARRLGLSPHTVRNHIDAIYTRLGLKEPVAAELRRDTVLTLALIVRRLQ